MAEEDEDIVWFWFWVSIGGFILGIVFFPPLVVLLPVWFIGTLIYYWNNPPR